MTTATRKRKSHEIEAVLRERIASRHWGSDRALPTERELAGELGVARNTLRAALLSLQEEGLISRHVGRGTVIRHQSTPDLTDIMQRFAGTSPRDLMQVRLIIEPQAVAAAALHAHESDLELIGGAHDRAVEARAPDEFEGWDSEFHRLIFASARNEFLVNLHDILHVIRSRKPWIEIKRRTFTQARRQLYCTEHAAILTALRARDPERALQAMAKHMTSISHNLFGAGGQF